MARYYDENGCEVWIDAPTRRAPPPRTIRQRHSAIEIVAYVLIFAIIGVTLYVAAPALRGRLAEQPSAAPARVYPTADASALQRYQREQEQTASEQQAINQTVPTADLNQPPLPVQETAATIAQPIVTSDQARGMSPIDLGWAPVPTPTTMLTQEQFDASQASEEQNQLNTAQSGLTEAQKLVQQHDAEQNAKP